MSTLESRELSALEEYWLDGARSAQSEPERKDRTVLMGKEKLAKKASICSHWQDKIQVGGYTVWVSGTSHKAESKAPDVGVFLDWQWSTLLGQSVFPALKENETGERDYFVDWPDMSTIPDPVFQEVVQFIAAEVKEGRQIEFGCVGGHGRTGTLLAGLIVEIEGLSAEKAIKATRSRHCQKAIETIKQVNMVYKLAGEAVLPTASKGSKSGGTSPVWEKGAYDDEVFDNPYPPVRANPNGKGFICAVCNHMLYACTCKVTVKSAADIANEISVELGGGLA